MNADKIRQKSASICIQRRLVRSFLDLCKRSNHLTNHTKICEIEWSAGSLAYLPSAKELSQNGYLSAALNPQTGEMFARLLPDMRVESFQAFLDELIGFVGEKTFVRLITDGAAAHRRIAALG